MENANAPKIVKKHPLFAKIAVWLSLFVLLYWLRSFFLLIFLTFIFSFLQFTAGEKLKPKILNRKVRTWLIGSVFLLLVSGTIYFLGTELKTQTKNFLHNFDTYIVAVDEQINNLSESFPFVEQMVIDMRYQAIQEGLSTKSPTLLILQNTFGIAELENSKNIKKNISALFLHSGKMIGVASSFLLSLLFSFLIILDYPRLTHSFARLERSRFAFVFKEVKPDIILFARMLGKAFEAQFFIAILNSILTFIGLLLIGVGKYAAFLISIVFICSFVPVAGVFISSIPICIVALQDHGVFSMFMAVILILVIHGIETYILNPRIYGSHMRMNPVVVLGILTIFGKLFGLWGLLLGVPLCNWFIKVVCLQQEKL